MNVLEGGLTATGMGQGRLLLGGTSLRAALLAQLPPALAAAVPPAEASGTPLEAVFANLFLQALCSLNASEWKRQAETLVLQV